MQRLWERLETTDLAMRIGESAWFPLLESLHVLGAVFMVGALLMLDLRLLGLAASNARVTQLTRELTPWIWSAFALASAAGAGLFAARASAYAANAAFQAKLVLLALAGLNMLVLHFGAYRSVARWDAARSPVAARAAGGASLLLWIGVMLAGRWVGHLY